GRLSGVARRSSSCARYKKSADGAFSCEPWFELVLTTGDFDQVITELSLDRTLYFTDRSTEYHLIKFGDHLATTGGAQVAAVAAGGAAGIFLVNLAEVCAVLDGGLELVGFFFGTDKDVTG